MNISSSWKRISLTSRAMALVTLALLPLGGIAIWQTNKIVKDSFAFADQSLIAVTESAAARERQIIERAIGAAAAIGNTAQSLVSDTVICSQALRQFATGSALYASAGFFPANGAAPCLSSPEVEMVADANLQALISAQSMGLYPLRAEAAAATSYLAVATPVFENGVYVGHIRLQVPHRGFATDQDGQQDVRPLGLVTFNPSGQILTSESSPKAALDLLPDVGALQGFRSDVPYTFEARAADGVERIYSLMPLVPGAAYAIASWDTDTELLQTGQSYWVTPTLAALMWLASLGVIFLIMHVLVIRGVQALERQLARFKTDRTMPRSAIEGRGELYDLEVGFRDMANTILHEEAELENALHEKDVLLKEVHHRVKNNLQLINSIINMVLRSARSDETRIVARRLQDRVMALASVHRSIYQAQSMDRVDASEVVREIVNQSVTIALPRGSDIEVDTALASVTLYPDQAMPLSMLVSEGITNALKYVGGEAPRVLVRLEKLQDEDDTARQRVRLVIENTLGAAVDDSEGTGLGNQLVRAFAHQLEGQLTTETRNGLYVMETTFDVAGFLPEPSDLPKAAE